MITFPDISFYQYEFRDPLRGDWTITGYVDFLKMRTMTPAVIIRAGQNIWTDRTFDISWQGAKDAGLLRGSYWFYDSRANPKTQAQLWVSILGNDTGELPLCADFEEKYGGPFAGYKNWKIFLEEVRRLVPGRDIFIYTGYYYWRANTIDAKISLSDMAYFERYPLWIANYQTSSPLVPIPWRSWKFWQFTENGRGDDYGVKTLGIDLNYYNGTEEDFLMEFTGESPRPSRTLTAKWNGRKIEYKERL